MDDRNLELGQSALRQAEGKYANMRKLRMEKEKEAAAHSDAVRQLYQCLLDLCSDVQEATGGTHVGASQCIEALNSALRKCQSAVSLLQTTTAGQSSGGGGGTFFGAGKANFSGGAGGKTGIRVGSEIGLARQKLAQQAESIDACREKLSALFTAQLQQNISMDTTAATDKYQHFNFRLTMMENAVTDFAAILAHADSAYAAEQKKAIARAMAIPK